MGLWELFLVAIGLSMDAFAVSISKGLAAPRIRLCDVSAAGLWFGTFQALMPLLGYFLGTRFAGYIQSVDHWVAFVLLSLIGGKMAYDARFGDEEIVDSSFTPNRMLPLAVATSIDALAVGVTFAFLGVHILSAVLLIGCTTFVLSAIGVCIGVRFGERFSGKAEIAGGFLLILLGIKILLEHLGILG